MRLDRHLSANTSHSNREISFLLAQNRVTVDGVVINVGSHRVDRFSAVSVDSQPLPSEVPRYLRLYKPAGILSATSDNVHKTVIDLIEEPWKTKLHLAGRLDRASTGLIILTNDGNWSKALTLAKTHIEKVYLVGTAEPILPKTVDQFREGFYFETEGVHTLPVEMEILTDFSCRLTLVEGRYHQIKRMFARTGNRVTTLHRERIANMDLHGLEPGDYEIMDPAQIRGNVAPSCKS